MDGYLLSPRFALAMRDAQELHMAGGLIGIVRNLFEGDPGVRRVADDPVLSAELLLLFRMALADGAASDSEMAALKRICRDSFGIAEASFDEVIEYLTDFGYETSGSQAILAFEEMDLDRRKLLVRHMAEIAKADASLAEDEMKLLKRALDVLGLSAEDVKGA